MNDFVSARLVPAELEERFWMETLARDKIQAITISALALATLIGFIALDLRPLPKGL